MKEHSMIRHVVMKNREAMASTLSILMDVHAIRGYLSEDDLQAVAEETGTSIVEIYGIVSSHPHFQVGGPVTDHPHGGSRRASPRPDVRCHHCNHSLLDTRWLIDGVPSIKLTVSFSIEYGWFRLSSLPGRRIFISEHELPRRGEAVFFCPHCHSQICSSSPCPGCGAPTVPMVTKSSMLLAVCSSPSDLCKRAPTSPPLGEDPLAREADRPERPGERSVPAGASECRIP